VSAYYNEIDKHAAQWLRNLIAAGHIAPGDVDERSITEVSPDDLRGYTQCHFFAGIGGWSYALRLAGWPDDRPVWTGSCPCQPFSAAGAQRGSNDERHLWPAFFRLIRECRPASVFGEQVAGAAGLAWLDHVCADLEDAGYAAAAADLCAAGVGAPHIRQRLYWVAHALREQAQRDDARRFHQIATGNCADGRLADATDKGPQGRESAGQRVEAQRQAAERTGAVGDDWLGDAASVGRSGRIAHGAGQQAEMPGTRHENVDPWATLEWLQCSDGKARPTQPGLFPLAHGVSGRVGRLRAYGNAIVPQVAAAFVMACQP
jgi:DNA (cytosine-5)-methyltransferase 1